MNRRGFLGLLAAAVAGATLDPERLLWTPGAKLISIPAVVPCGNTFLTYEEYTREVLYLLKRNLVFEAQINRDHTLNVLKSLEGDTFLKSLQGDPLNVRRPFILDRTARRRGRA